MSPYRGSVPDRGVVDSWGLIRLDIVGWSIMDFLEVVLNFLLGGWLLFN